MKKENLIAADGKSISLTIWDEVENPVAVVQIIHGMSEHIGRYDEFAKYLNEQGFIVAGDDHRAHGETDKDALGLSGEGDLFENTVGDELSISDLLKDVYNLPLIIFGHSYGSFLSQRYLTVSPDMTGIVLSGSAFQSGLPIIAGSFLANMKSKKKKDEKGDIFVKMTFDAYDKKINEGKGAWLNRDKAEVEKYYADPLNGFTASNGFYKDFFNGLKTIASSKLDKIPKDLPIFIISGDKDWVGGCGKLVTKLRDRYAAAGLNVKMKLYEGARHELTNETCRKEVFADVAAFVNECIKPKKDSEVSDQTESTQSAEKEGEAKNEDAQIVEN